jgi:hypothetical protein
LTTRSTITRQAERFGAVHEVHEVAERPVLLIDAVVVGDVVAVVAIRGGVERLEPDAGDAEAGEVFETATQTFEVTDAVAVRVLVLLDVEAVDDGVLVPEIVDRHAALSSRVSAARHVPRRTA